MFLTLFCILYAIIFIGTLACMTAGGVKNSFVKYKYKDGDYQRICKKMEREQHAEWDAEWKFRHEWFENHPEPKDPQEQKAYYRRFDAALDKWKKEYRAKNSRR